MPPDAVMGSVLVETVYSWNAGVSSVRVGTIASWNTSQGPAKSIIVAPSEIRNATGMLPLAGGFSGFESTEGAAPNAFGRAADRPSAILDVRRFLRVSLI